jgi:hypothetical protein
MGVVTLNPIVWNVPTTADSDTWDFRDLACRSIVGSTRRCLKRSSVPWTRNRRRCAYAARPASICSGRSRRVGATNFLMKQLHNVKTEMSLAVLAYNLTRFINIVGIGTLIAAIREILRLIKPDRARKIVSTALTCSWMLICAKLRVETSSQRQLGPEVEF